MSLAAVNCSSAPGCQARSGSPSALVTSSLPSLIGCPARQDWRLIITQYPAADPVRRATIHPRIASQSFFLPETRTTEDPSRASSPGPRRESYPPGAQSNGFWRDTAAGCTAPHEKASPAAAAMNSSPGDKPTPQIQPCRYKVGKTLGAGSYSVVKEVRAHRHGALLCRQGHQQAADGRPRAHGGWTAVEPLLLARQTKMGRGAVAGPERDRRAQEGSRWATRTSSRSSTTSRR